MGYVPMTVVVVAILATLSIAANGGYEQLDWMGGVCQGTVGECAGVEELSMDSDINRRILATSQYISYAALRRNTVPCSRRGASYYNCRGGAQANPYRRGCSAITLCRG